MKRFAQAVVTALGMVLAVGNTAHAQTAHQTFLACRQDAYDEAFDCFIASTGYWDERACGFWWDVNDVACDMALVKSVLPD
jgi:hypothetical protein